MTNNVLYHNPRCSKSRQTLALLEEKNIEFDIVEYLKTPPNKDDLKFICDYLKISPTKIIRTKDTIFKELELDIKEDLSNEEWITIMINNPKLIERPIFVYNDKAAIGRPPENVLEII